MDTIIKEETSFALEDFGLMNRVRRDFRVCRKLLLNIDKGFMNVSTNRVGGYLEEIKVKYD